MSLLTSNAQNKLTWTCQFDGVKSISIQRSVDSVRNFLAIGSLSTPKKGIQTYTDLHPVVGKNYYRLCVIFSGDLQWFSNTYKVLVDSATFAKAMQDAEKANAAKLIAQKNSDSIKKAIAVTNTSNAKPRMQDSTLKVNKVASTDSVIKAAAPPPPPIEEKPKEFFYTPSAQVYNNPYTGHVNINLPDALSKKYSIRFLDPDKNEVLRVARVTKTELILDKNNFNAKGVYQFQLYDGLTLVESGYVTIY